MPTRNDRFKRRPLRWLAAAALALACGAVPANTADVQFPVGSSIGLTPPPGLRLEGNSPGFFDPDNKVSMLVLELPRVAYPELAASITSEAAKTRGITVDHRETLLTDAGAALVSAGEDPGEKARKWMVVALLPKFTALISVQIPDAARDRYPDSAIRTALATLTERPMPIAELLDILPYKLEEMAGFRIVTVLRRSTVVLTDGPRDEFEAVEQPRVVIGVSPGRPADDDRSRLAQQAFNNIPGFLDRRVTVSEPIRIEGQPAHEIRADAREAMTGKPVTVVQWLRFGQNAYVHILAVTPKEHWSRDFPRFRAVRDGIQPRR